MKARNGAMTGAKACSGWSSPAIIGSMPFAQASVKTGSITNQVRKSARLTIIMLGGAWLTPIAWRRIESTVTMNGKQVTMIASPGASESSVISTKSWTVRRLNDCPSPRSIEMSCAAAGSPRRTKRSPAARPRRRITRRRQGSEFRDTLHDPVAQTSAVAGPNAVIRGPGLAPAAGRWSRRALPASDM